MWVLIQQKWPFGVLAVVLVIAAISDVRTGKIRNSVTYPAIIIGVIVHCIGGAFFPGKMGTDLHGQQIGLAGSLIGFAAGFVPMFIAWRSGGIGGGDAKLMGAIGALAGLHFALATMFYGFIVAGVMAIIVMLRRRIMKRTLGRVWRFLLVLLMTPSRPGDPADEDSPKIAFGLALCIGAAIELVDVCFGGPMAKGMFG